MFSFILVFYPFFFQFVTTEKTKIKTGDSPFPLLLVEIYASNKKLDQLITPNLKKELTPNHLYTNNYPSFIFRRKRLPSHGAGNEIRTRDSKLGKLVLYQLSYARIPWKKYYNGK